MRSSLAEPVMPRRATSSQHETYDTVRRLIVRARADYPGRTPQKRLAAAAGITQGNASRILKGDVRSLPALSRMVALLLGIVSEPDGKALQAALRRAIAAMDHHERPKGRPK